MVSDLGLNAIVFASFLLIFFVGLGLKYKRYKDAQEIFNRLGFQKVAPDAGLQKLMTLLSQGKIPKSELSYDYVYSGAAKGIMMQVAHIRAVRAMHRKHKSRLYMVVRASLSRDYPKFAIIPRNFLHNIIDADEVEIESPNFTEKYLMVSDDPATAKAALTLDQVYAISQLKIDSTAEVIGSNVVLHKREMGSMSTIQIGDMLGDAARLAKVLG